MNGAFGALADSVSLDWSPLEIPRLTAPDVTAFGDGSAAAADTSRCVEIGRSREDRPLYGFRLGNGPTRLSLVAGAHADEPLGPSTLLALARWLLDSPHAAPLLERGTFTICPHINPDGAERNVTWSRRFPCSIEEYVEHVERELPGDDVEFGYPRSPADDRARPENVAVARFLASGAPYSFHASLHGMAIAEGAWFLLDREHAPATTALRRDLVACCERLGVPLHDQDRRGEKGFSRIAPGFATTPTSTAMRDFFLASGDARTAALFRPSSMEHVAALGGAPLCAVSEVPLFLVTPATPGPELGARFAAAREGLLALRAAGPARRAEIAAELRSRFGLAPLPVATGARLLLALVFLGSGLLSLEELSASLG